MKTVIGPLCDDLGQAMRQHVTNDLWHPLRRECWAVPAGEYRRVQAADIPIHIGHAPEPIAGKVVHLERRSGRLWCVAHLFDWVREPDDVPTYWSAETTHADGTDIELTAVGITQRPAQLGTRPLQWLAGALEYRSVARERWHLDGFERKLITRAAAIHLDRRGGQPLIVHDAERRPDLDLRSTLHPAEIEAEQWEPGRPPGRLQRSAPYRGVIAVR